MRAVRFVLVVAGFMSMTAATWGQAPSTTAPAGRTMQEIGKDLQAATVELKKVMGSQADMLDADKRAAMAPKAIPLIKRIEGLMMELTGVSPGMAKQVAPRRLQLVAMRDVLGDAGAAAELKAMSESADPAVALAGKTWILTGDWIRTAHDPAAQGKVLDRSEALAKGSPEDVGVAMLLASYVQFGAASPENRGRAVAIIQKELKGPVGDDLRGQLARRAAAATKPGL